MIRHNSVEVTFSPSQHSVVTWSDVVIDLWEEHADEDVHFYMMPADRKEMVTSKIETKLLCMKAEDKPLPTYFHVVATMNESKVTCKGCLEWMHS